MKRPKSVLGGKWTLDTYATPCRCGGKVTLARRGPIARMLGGHRAPDGSPCPALEAEQDEARTIRAIEAIEPVGPAEAARRLADARRG